MHLNQMYIVVYMVSIYIYIYLSINIYHMYQSYYYSFSIQHTYIYIIYLLIFLILIIIIIINIQYTNIASRKLAKNGNGTSPDSCMLCDPAIPTCPFGCQKHVTKLYRNCKGVCLPDGFYFDPSKYIYNCYSFVFCFVFV